MKREREEVSRISGEERERTLLGWGWTGTKRENERMWELMVKREIDYVECSITVKKNA